ncbi:hypothetical protein IPA_09255 [Ignicoccus pacificus DSM 13166]|uniref:Uncharacterized protein n=1 Tax=Ignicoccus pacificus DSM 13166 TaxID=940294 RepID=A0A977PM19_9CREN|nr:hypothetical protein IPA_09255 [Ignicoccus pacificus DSM 13166]
MGVEMKVIAYEGLPFECEGVEDAEAVAALLGEVGEMLRKLGLRKVVVGEDGVVIGEG